jgi:hypothetical protein
MISVLDGRSSLTVPAGGNDGSPLSPHHDGQFET